MHREFLTLINLSPYKGEATQLKKYLFSLYNPYAVIIVPEILKKLHAY